MEQPDPVDKRPVYVEPQVEQITPPAHRTGRSGPTIRLGRAWAMIIILSTLFVVSMVDRYALGLLVPQLKQDLGLSDVQLGFLFGSAFAIFYGAVTIPLARFADRGSRVRLILFGVFLWSACTILSGFATSFLMLVALRIGLAIGEAALGPATFSLIGDILPPNRRTLGGAIFNSFGMAGASGAYIIGSAAISFTDAVQSEGFLTGLRAWQAMFIIIGLPAVLLGLIFAMVAKEPASAAVADDVEAPSFLDVLGYARSQGWLYAGLFLGAGCMQMGTNGFLAWTPTYLSRAHGMTIVDAGRIYGFYNLAAFVGGSMIIPLLGVWVGRYRRDGIVWVGAACATASSLFCVMAVLQSSPSSFLLCAFLGLFFSVGGASNAVSSLHMFTPSRMRATLTAAMLVCLTAVALGVAPPLVGALSSSFGTGKAALGVGLGLVAALGGLMAILLLFAARKRVLLYLATAGAGEVAERAVPVTSRDQKCSV